MKLVYISHPFGGKEENLIEIQAIIENILLNRDDVTPISPVHSFGFLYDFLSYTKGLGLCLDLLCKCDEMWVYGDYLTSKGCRTEIAFCESCNIPYRIMNEKGE